MMQKVLSRISLVILLAYATNAFAHDEYRIIGVITRIQKLQTQVKTKEGKSFMVKLNTETYIHRDKQKEKMKNTELKVGNSVVVDALGDDETDLLALEVRIVPAITSSAK
jgi:hypothetical protein